MYSLDFVDDYVLDRCKKQFSSVYPEFRGYPIGASSDKTCLIFSCSFPDGQFYFRVDERSVSSAYDSKEDADRG